MTEWSVTDLGTELEETATIRSTWARKTWEAIATEPELLRGVAAAALDSEALGAEADGRRDAVEMLAGELRQEMERIGAVMPWETPAGGPDAMQDKGGLWIDRAFLVELKKTGNRGNDLAFRESKKSWARWAEVFEERRLPHLPGAVAALHLFSLWMAPGRPGQCQAAELLARALWADRVRERWERKPAVPLGGLLILTRATRRDDGNIYLAGGPVGKWTPRAPILPEATTGLLGLSVAEQKAIRQVLFDAWVTGKETLIYAGFAGMGAAIGMRGATRGRRLREALRRIEGCLLQVPGWEPKPLLWVTGETRGRRGHKAEIMIHPNPLLLPAHVHKWANSARRKLVFLPPEPGRLVGRPREHGNQLAMQWDVMELFTERAEEFAERGSIVITPGARREMADRVRMPGRLLARVWEFWGQDWLPVSGPGRYGVADEGVAKRLRDLGTGVKRRRRGGKAGARKRWRR